MATFRRNAWWKKLLLTLAVIVGSCALLNSRRHMTDIEYDKEVDKHQLPNPVDLKRNIKKYNVNQGNSFQGLTGDESSVEYEQQSGEKIRANLTHPKSLLLLSYMRSGSSFVGDIFHHTPDVFYIYEPLDPLYVALYGSADGWVVPADIFFFPNGTQRIIPEDEIKAVEWTLETIFTCNIASWPSAMLRHTFWHAWGYKMKDIKPYQGCLKSHNLTGSAASNKLCSKHIGAVCGGRFNAAKKQLPLCRSILWNAGKWFSSREEIAAKLDSFALSENRSASPDAVISRLFKSTRAKLIDSFAQYFSCHDKLSAPLRRCAAASFDTVCANRSLRVVKTVRASPLSTDGLLDDNKDHDFKFIHLLRDPRGYARSKNKSGWAQGLFEKNNATIQALAYCQRVVKNEQDALSVTHVHSKLMTLLYDKVAQDPLTIIKKIFDFLGEPSVPKETLKWLAENTDGVVKDKIKTSSKSLANKWMETFLFKEVKDINEGCMELFKLIDYDWTLC